GSGGDLGEEAGGRGRARRAEERRRDPAALQRENRPCERVLSSRGVMIIVQLSDLHVCPSGVSAYGRVPTNDMLRTAIAQVNALRPRADVVLATGDLAHAGAVEEYAMLREFLAELEMPIYLVPGNHDDRANFRKVFGDSDYLPETGEFVHYTVDDHPVRLIG